MGCYSQKYPDFPHSLDMWRTKIIQRAEAKEATLDQWPNILLGEGTRLATSKTIYTPNTSSLKPGSGATEGVLD